MYIPLITDSLMMGAIPIPLGEKEEQHSPLGSDWSSIREAGGNGAALQTRCDKHP